MEDMITQEIEDTPAEEMSAEQEADFEKVFDSDTQAADAMEKTEKADRKPEKHSQRRAKNFGTACRASGDKQGRTDIEGGTG